MAEARMGEISEAFKLLKLLKLLKRFRDASRCGSIDLSLWHNLSL